jgi:hypothetical protein
MHQRIQPSNHTLFLLTTEKFTAIQYRATDTVCAVSATASPALAVIKLLNQQPSVIFLYIESQAAHKGFDLRLAFFPDLDLEISPAIGLVVT